MSAPNVLTAYEQSFQQTVIERSHEVPVLVDFWAPWCGPCRVLSPLLEALAAEGEGAWLLVKVNTDENQGLARKYQVQGIPYCVLFKDGKVVDSFVGVQSKPTVQRFLQKWVLPKEDDALSGVDALVQKGSYDEARRTLEPILAKRPDDERARLAIARLELAAGRPDQALDHLAYLPAEGSHARDIASISARARFAKNLPTPTPPLDELEAAVEANPDDFELRMQLGSLAALHDQRDHAAIQFLTILERERNWKDGAARNALVDLFNLWGDEAPETEHYRQQMGWVLFA